ncbi:MAG: carotenoid biosynthesis protein [Anaerolineae bacterium]
MQVKTFYPNQTIHLKQLAASLPAPYLFSGWILSMIALPIAIFFGGQAVLPTVITFSALLQVTLVLTFLIPAWGWRVTLRTALLVMGLAWLIEFTGSTTGYPFGAYHYTDLMQPQIGGVPLLIPLAWLMMLPPAWAVARRIAGPHSRLAFIAWSALTMTAWDLFLDPQMVAWGLWSWAQPGGYFDIPWINFLGWLLASALITAVVRPGPLPTRPLMLIYAITWLLESLGLFFFWGLPGPALVGFAGMGSLLWLAFMKRKIGD